MFIIFAQFVGVYGKFWIYGMILYLQKKIWSKFGLGNPNPLYAKENPVQNLAY
jgi:hypothetical protein